MDSRSFGKHRRRGPPRTGKEETERIGGVNCHSITPYQMRAPR